VWRKPHFLSGPLSGRSAKARNYLAPAAGAFALVGLLLGYTVTGMFTRR
jgi:hypothetical protein